MYELMYLRVVIVMTSLFRMQLQALGVSQELLRVLRSQDSLLSKLPLHWLQKHSGKAREQEPDAAC